MAIFGAYLDTPTSIFGGSSESSCASLESLYERKINEMWHLDIQDKNRAKAEKDANTILETMKKKRCTRTMKDGFDVLGATFNTAQGLWDPVGKYNPLGKHH